MTSYALPACNAVIVNYRTPELVARCIASIREHAILPDDAICVVDNSVDGSADRIAALCPGIKLVRAAVNDGFGGGVNRGVAATDRETVLVLNPDTLFPDRSVERAAALLAEDEGIGVVGLDLRNTDGSRQWSARRDYSLVDVLIRRTPLKRVPPFSARDRRHLMCDAWQGRAFDTDWVMGTGFLIRRRAFEQVGGMDTGFFLYMEDVDLCARVRAAGWRVVAAVNAVLMHDHRRSSAKGLMSEAARRHLASLRHYIRKHGMPLV